jgi:PAS domain S-box-containing protein
VPPLILLLIALLLSAHAGSAVTTEARTAEQPGAATPPVTEQDVGRQPRRVLALYSYGADHPVTITFDRQFQAVLQRQAAADTVRYPEYLDPGRFAGESQGRFMRDYLRQKYADRKIDVLFCWGVGPLEFLLRHQGDLFPGTPIVYYLSSLEPLKDLPAPPITGVQNPDAYERTLELALNLHPDTTEVFVVSGTPSHDKSIEREAAPQFARFQSRVTLTYLTDLPLDQLLATVRNLPRRSIIFYSRQAHEDPARVLQPFDFLDPISRAATVPIYSPWRSYLGSGTVGGLVDDPVAGATKAAEIVLRVARGARPGEIPPDRVPKTPLFDARQLARWGITEDKLPAGNVVLFREPTFWARYRGYIIGTGVVVAIQTLLIAGLLVQRARRRQVEAELRESEKRYALATAAGAVGIWDWDLETHEIYVDPALRRALGFDDDESDEPDSWDRALHPDDADRLRADAQACVDARTPFFENEHRRLHRDGSVHWFMTRGSAVRHADARVTRITGTVTDITERKRAEANLEETRHDLARVARVTSIAQCAASIAHELSQPLASIQLNSKACLRWMAGSGASTDELHGALQDIAEAATLANGVITRDREQFRYHTVEKEVLDVNDVVREVASLVRTRLQQSQVTLDVMLASDLPHVRGDRVELQQVLLNLILNSIEAMETVDRRSRRITIDTRLTAERHEGAQAAPVDQVQTTVRDTGPGLNETDVDRLFTPFYTTKPRGTGIGLSISRFIIETHEGRLWAEPSEGRGAAFCFTVPVATGRADADADTGMAGVVGSARDSGAKR